MTKFLYHALVISVLLCFSFYVDAKNYKLTAKEDPKISLYKELNQLPIFERKLIVLMAYHDTDEYSKSLSMANSKNVIWSLKVISAEHYFLADLAAESKWPEMEKWFTDNSNQFVLVINGKKTITDLKKESPLTKAKYQDILSKFTKENSQYMSKKPSEKFSALRVRTKSYIAAYARMYASTY